MALVGNLKDLKLPNLIQLNCMERNVAQLTIEARGNSGEIYFENGQIVHAMYGDLEGEKAIYELLLFKEGMFRIENNVRSDKQSIFTSWSNLLLESMRVIDEGKGTEEGQLEDVKQSILAVKGVIECEILDDSGEIVSSSVSEENRLGYSYLVVFSFKEAEMEKEMFGDERLNFLSMKLPQSKILSFKYGTYYVIVEYEQKYQIENIVPNIVKFKMN